jgi:hypothetical protein
MKKDEPLDLFDEGIEVLTRLIQDSEDEVFGGEGISLGDGKKEETKVDEQKKKVNSLAISYQSESQGK